MLNQGNIIKSNGYSGPHPITTDTSGCLYLSVDVKRPFLTASSNVAPSRPENTGGAQGGSFEPIKRRIIVKPGGRGPARLKRQSVEAKEGTTIPPRDQSGRAKRQAKAGYVCCQSIADAGTPVTDLYGILWYSGALFKSAG
jgi:hypothetical protein